MSALKLYTVKCYCSQFVIQYLRRHVVRKQINFYRILYFFLLLNHSILLSKVYLTVSNLLRRFTKYVYFTCNCNQCSYNFHTFALPKQTFLKYTNNEIKEIYFLFLSLMSIAMEWNRTIKHSYT